MAPEGGGTGQPTWTVQGRAVPPWGFRVSSVALTVRLAFTGAEQAWGPFAEAHGGPLPRAVVDGRLQSH